jgi:iron-sulfur cluster repair protein YtfE (RIC family)
MDPFELLKKDHETVSDLFKRIEAADRRAKLGIFKQLKSELEVHTHIEETIFYPALEKARETRDLTLEAYEEHRVVKDLLVELDGAQEHSDEWDAQLTVLRENVEHHVDEEENELFDKANDVLTGAEAENIGDRMQTEKARQGASPAVEDEKPGLLQTIANALGLGSSSEDSSAKGSQTKKTNKKRPVKTVKKTADTKTIKKSAVKKAGATKSAKQGAVKPKSGSALATSKKGSAKRTGKGSTKRAAKGTASRKTGSRKTTAKKKKVSRR